MSNEEHINLAQLIKEVHHSLRKSTILMGAEKAWQDHCTNKPLLATYAQCMEKLATTHWEKNCANSLSEATSRIKWSADLCQDYFVNKSYLRCREMEKDIAKRLNITLDTEEEISEHIKVIDVGSCYNPFKIYGFLDVFAIDLCPANDTVFQCDFLKVPIGSNMLIQDNEVHQIQHSFFDVVIFSFLLEYLPLSDLRIMACEKAYSVLKQGGLLIINTPDSKHVSANSRLMKCWRYTLACMGFHRIKYEKFKHMHCMAFRKTLDKNIAKRWASIHKEPYMDYCINIPQDFYNYTEEQSTLPQIQVSMNDFEELPFNQHFECHF